MWVYDKKLVYAIQHKDKIIIKVLGYILDKDIFEYILKLPSGGMIHKLGSISDMNKDIHDNYGRMEGLSYLFKVKNILNNQSSIEFGSLYDLNDIKRTFMNFYKKQENRQFAF